jgi:release factor glutamine methyltransferase
MAHLLTWPEQALTDTQQKEFEQLCKKRQQGRPVAYLTGQREFWSLALEVNPSTLIPRPETETLVDFVLTRFPPEPALKLLDMGTGSGAIAISIASERPGWTVTASDISQAALDTAQRNAEHNHVRLSLINSNWFDAIEQNDFDIIISNPPYIASSDPHLGAGDVRFEPETALVSGNDGLDAIGHLCQHASDHLVSHGWLIVEHGYDQKESVRRCFTGCGFNAIVQLDDLAGQPRMTAGQKSSDAH